MKQKKRRKMRQYLLKHSCLFCGLVFGMSACQLSQTDKSPLNSDISMVMNGLSNKKGQEGNRYLTAGDKTYIIGTQDGNFPDLGSHVTGEMGGVWNHLIKLLDGFWVRVYDVGENPVWLEQAKNYTSYPYGSEFIYSPVLDGIEVSRFQFCPQGRNGVVVTYTLKNQSDRDRELAFDFIAKTDLSPVWSSEQIGLRNAGDTISWNVQQSVFEASDMENSWYVVWGTNEKPIEYSLDVSTYVNTAGLGKSASSTYKLLLKKGEEREISFVIAGSKNEKSEALTCYEDIFHHKSELLKQKKSFYTHILERGRITIPDKRLQEVYNWCKVNTEWLVADLDNVGRFLGAGAVEYQWLFGCDNSYALQGVVAAGDHRLAEETLTVIKNMSEKANGNGRILHEMAFNAYVSHKGNTQETAHFIVAVWDVFKWTGNKAFLADMYPYMKKGIDFLLKDMDTNGNLFPEGYGIMEVSGLNAELIDVAVYTQQALEAMAEISGIMGDKNLSAPYTSQATILKNKINDLFWDDELGIYCDFYGTREQALQTTKGAISQIKGGWDENNKNTTRSERVAIYEEMYTKFEKQPAGITKGWLTNKNWVISTPLETHIAPQERAISQLDKVREEHCGEFGPYLAAVEKMHMMTISTGVQAMAECAYGRIDEGLWYVKRIIDTFSRVLPGSIAEMMPDYGCPVQAWTAYGVIRPLIQYIYGISPNAYKQIVTLSPNLPSGWNQIEIEALPIGNNVIDYKVKRLDNGLEIILETSEADWQYNLRPAKLPIRRFVLNGKEQPIL